MKEITSFAIYLICLICFSVASVSHAQAVAPSNASKTTEHLSPKEPTTAGLAQILVIYKENSTVSTWRTLIEVHQETNQIEPLLFAQRQSEIILSRKNLLRTVDELFLNKKWKLNNEQCIRILQKSISSKVTKGGLIVIEAKVNSIQGSETLRKEDAELLLKHIVKLYDNNIKQLRKKATDARIAHLKEELKAQEARTGDSRFRYFKTLQKLKIFNKSDIEKLPYETLIMYNEVYTEYQSELKITQKLSNQMRELKQHFQDYKLLDIHAEPYLVK